MIAKLKLVIESVNEIAGSYPDHFFDWRIGSEDALCRHPRFFIKKQRHDWIAV